MSTEHRGRYLTKGFVLRVRAADAPRVENVLEGWLKGRRWPSGAQAMLWLAEAHPEVVAGAVLPEDLSAEQASRALELVKGHVRER